MHNAICFWFADHAGLYLHTGMSLRFSEEIALLALDDSTGKLHPLPERSFELAVAGALLMELAFADKIDTDLESLKILDRSPTGDALLDKVMGSLPEDSTLPIRRAISIVAADSPQYEKQIFEQLRGKGILQKEEHRYFFVMKERRYPVKDDKEEKEVIARIREVIIDGVIPGPKDVVIVCLMQACDLGSAVFSDKELNHYNERITAVAKMDLIGQALSRAVQEIQKAILESIAYMGM